MEKQSGRPDADAYAGWVDSSGTVAKGHFREKKNVVLGNWEYMERDQKDTRKLVYPI